MPPEAGRPGGEAGAGHPRPQGGQGDSRQHRAAQGGPGGNPQGDESGLEGLNQRLDPVIAPPDSSANLRLQAREAAKREREEEKLRQQLQLGIPLGQGDVYQGTVLFKADALDRLEEFRERDLEAYVVVLGFKARLVMVTRQHAVVQLMPPLDLSNLKAHSNAIASNGVRLQGFHGGVVHDRLVWKAAALLGEDGKRLPKQAILRFLIPNPTRLVEKLPVAEIRPAKRRAVALETMEAEAPFTPLQSLAEAHWETEKERVEPTEPEPIKESEPTEEPTKATKVPEPIEEQPTKEPTKAPEPGSTKEPEPSEPKELWEMTVHGRVVRFSIEQNVGFSPLGPVREVKMEPGDADFLAPIRCHPKGIVFNKEGLYHIAPDYWSKNVTQVAKELEPTAEEPMPTEDCRGPGGPTRHRAAPGLADELPVRRAGGGHGRDAAAGRAPQTPLPLLDAFDHRHGLHRVGAPMGAPMGAPILKLGHPSTRLARGTCVRPTAAAEGAVVNHVLGTAARENPAGRGGGRLRAHLAAGLGCSS